MLGGDGRGGGGGGGGGSGGGVGGDGVGSSTGNISKEYLVQHQQQNHSNRKEK